MTLAEQVFAQALTLAGELDERQSGLLRVLSGSVCAGLKARLRKGLTAEDCLADFVSAASLMALAALSEAGEPETVESFTAGEVSVRKSRSSAAANCLRYQAQVMMMPYVRDPFAFMGV